MSDSVKHQPKIYCANCLHCKTVTSPSGEGFQLRVRCAKGQWKKRQGDEKYYKYFTVTRRRRSSCEFYEAMGDSDSFLKELRENLPLADEVYGKQSSPIAW